MTPSETIRAQQAENERLTKELSTATDKITAMTEAGNKLRKCCKVVSSNWDWSDEIAAWDAALK